MVLLYQDFQCLITIKFSKNLVFNRNSPKFLKSELINIIFFDKLVQDLSEFIFILFAL